jgi:tetratricopeptide (TPR) repeat protein
MTPKQEERIRDKISKIKKALAADKRQWGGFYHDGSGLRYLPPELFLKLKDYKRALIYFRWFDKNFPDDCGYPIFLLEWTMTLFKTGKIKEAEKKALQTFISNTYLFDKFLGKEILNFDKYEGSNWEKEDLTYNLAYSKEQEDIQDFVDWLNQFLESDKFYKIANEFIDIEQ